MTFCLTSTWRRVVAGGAALLWLGAPASAQLQQVAEDAIDSVFLVGVAFEDGSFEEVGTAWTIAPNKLATNAHVAEALIDYKGETGRIVARRGLLDRNEVVIGDALIHPAYNAWNSRLQRMLVGSIAQLKNFNVIGVADVAILDVVAGDAGQPLRCANVSDPGDEPKLGDDIMYLGYPMENLSGFATLHAVVGNVTAKTDYFFMRTEWPKAHLIHFSGPTTGGASGSPVLDARGHVIGLLSAGEHLLINQGEARVSFGFTYAQRVDLALELLDGSYIERQAQRNREWTTRAYDLFIKPDQIIDGNIELHAEANNLPVSSIEMVTQRQDTLTQQEDERRVRVVLEPGYRYGFLAVAHDGTDIDSTVALSDDSVLGSDFAMDQFPVVWVDPRAERTEAFFNIRAAQSLLGPTPVAVRIVRYDASLASATPGPEGQDQFWSETLTTDFGGEQRHTWTFQLDPGQSYTFSATSNEQLDIDLKLTQNGAEIDSDVLLDWFPVVTASGVSGEVTLELIMPAATAAGAIVNLEASSSGAGSGMSDPPGFDDAWRTFWEATWNADQDGEHSVTWTIDSLADLRYKITADSVDGLDIDMRAIAADGAVLSEDVLLDSFPIVEFDGNGQTITIELIFPATTTAGTAVEIVGSEADK
ncbi:MAG: trypsin-like peptidase domain-containing protein [Phycisphaeraceae bacterium]|nr:trypsin-like peptidase domain-containing protein [Phycisphaeraceae bacterium]